MREIYDANGNTLSVGGKGYTEYGYNLRITDFDKAFTDSGTISTAKDAEGYCITDFYDLGVYVGRYLAMCFPNTESGNDGKVLVMYNNETYGTYRYEQFQQYSTSMGEQKLGFNNTHTQYNKGRFTLKTQYLDYAYAYWTDTGEVLFAGKLSNYYGYTNVNYLTDGLEIEKEITGVMTAPAVRYPNLTAEYISQVRTNYTAWLTDIKSNVNRIPFIVSADQHGIRSAKVDTFRLIGDVVNMHDLQFKFINLGDTCPDSFDADYPKAYLDATKGCPKDKHVLVAGNHDIYYSDGTKKFSSDQHNLMEYFSEQTGGMRVFSTTGYGYVIDNYFNVKYLIINNMEFSDSYSGSSGIEAQRISTAQMNFVVAELSKADGYDIIIVCHCPINNTMTNRDGESHTDWAFLGDASVLSSFQTMIAARKTKSSGTVTDSDGVSHSYDFGNCNSDILIDFHGHSHFEGQAKVGTVPQFDFDWMNRDSMTFYFGYFDRSTNKIKVWRNAATASAAWEVDYNS